MRAALALVVLLVSGCPSDDPPPQLTMSRFDVSPPGDVGPSADARQEDLPDPVDIDEEISSDVTGQDAPEVSPRPDVPPDCTVDLDCLDILGDLGPCLAPLCEDGACSADGLPNGTPCSDGNPCTVEDMCSVGVCEPGPVACEDDNVCTQDLCDTASGACTFTPLSDTPCDDGDLCTTPDVCSGGVCESTPAECPSCSNNDDCAPLDDGNLCNGVPACFDGQCQNSDAVVDCSDIPTSSCQDAVCVPETGACAVMAVPDGSPCNPGSLCLVTGFCNSGSCLGSPANCDDANACTEDGCDESVGCFNTPLSGAPCDDSSPCTEDDFCLVGKCVGQALQGCDDNNPCTSDDCDTVTGACSNTPIDGPCDDGDACTGPDNCAEAACVTQPLDCDDANLCTEDACSFGTCVHVKIACDDGDPCTVDVCEADAGCQSQAGGGVCAQASDCGMAPGCAVWTCSACGECVTIPKDCDDGNPCTKDTCTDAAGCVYGPNNGAPCEDGVQCTTGDVCSNGLCTPGVNTCEPGTQSNPALSCLVVRQALPAAPDGPYWLKPLGVDMPFQTWCDMDTLGGGWTRVAFVTADRPICNYAAGFGDPAALATTPTATTAMPASLVAQIPFLYGEVLVKTNAGAMVYSSGAPDWGWPSLADGTINAANAAESLVFGAVNGSTPVAMQNVPATGGQQGAALLGGNSGQGYGIFLGVGAQWTGHFQQDAACEALALKGFWGGTWLGPAAWQQGGSISIR